MNSHLIPFENWLSGYESIEHISEQPGDVVVAVVMRQGAGKCDRAGREYRATLLARDKHEIRMHPGVACGAEDATGHVEVLPGFEHVVAVPDGGGENDGGIRRAQQRVDSVDLQSGCAPGAAVPAELGVPHA